MSSFWRQHVTKPLSAYPAKTAGALAQAPRLRHICLREQGNFVAKTTLIRRVAALRADLVAPRGPLPRRPGQGGRPCPGAGRARQFPVYAAILPRFWETVRNGYPGQ